MSELATDPTLDTDWTWRTLVAVTNTTLVPKAYQGKPHDAYVAVKMGEESGLGPMTSLNMIDVIQGKASFSTELSVSLVNQKGHILLATELTPESCTAWGLRKGFDEKHAQSYTFTMDDAKAAGLKGGSWATFPASMLWVRAASQLIRMYFPDCLISFHNYDPSELEPPQDSVAPNINSLPTVETSQSPAIEGATDVLDLEPGQAYREEEDATRPFE